METYGTTRGEETGVINGEEIGRGRVIVLAFSTYKRIGIETRGHGETS
jgi:hypothetical protein